MRISDWSSDVCSSDLGGAERGRLGGDEEAVSRPRARRLFAAEAFDLRLEVCLDREHRVRWSGRADENLRRQHHVHLLPVAAQRKHKARGLEKPLMVGADGRKRIGLMDETGGEN